VAPGPEHYIRPRLTTLGQAHDLGLLFGQPARGVRAVRSPDQLYHELRAIDAKRHYPCVHDVFAAVVSYTEGDPARPWWELTPERKAHGAVREKSQGEEAR
jgi:hypothetical protein